MKIHYDCDPGQDDAIALLFALGAGVDVASVSIVGGNVDVEKCTRNALQILEFAGRTDVPVYKGAAQPLMRMSQPLPEVFGECGMAGANLPEPTTLPQAMGAVDFLAACDYAPIVVATGPLTNLALAIQKNPAVANHIQHLYIMGGCVYPEHLHGRLGNIEVKGSDGWAEYNFAVDPEAAQIVFASGIEHIYLVPLNITRQVLYRYAVDAALRAAGTKSADLAANILSTVGAEDHIDYAAEKLDALDPVRAVHDVVAMAYLTDPQIFEVEDLPIRIEIGAPPLAAGQSLVDWDAPDHTQIHVIKKVDVGAFMDLMVRYMSV